MIETERGERVFVHNVGLARHPEGEAGVDGLDAVRKRLANVRNGKLVTIEDAGHMLHHDQPVAVAAAIEPFLAS